MQRDKSKHGSRGVRFLMGAAVLGLGLFGLSPLQRFWLNTFGAPRLISMQEIDSTYEAGDACERPVRDNSGLNGSPQENLFSAFEPASVHAQAPATVENDRPAIRQLMDTAPTYSSVSVDVAHDEVYLQDSNLWSIRVFSRLDNAKPGDPPTEPRRVIKGPGTALQFNSCVWIDPTTADVYSVENDTGNIIAVYPREATGDALPKRTLTVTHRAYAMTVDPGNQRTLPFGAVPATDCGLQQDSFRKKISRCGCYRGQKRASRTPMA